MARYYDRQGKPMSLRDWIKRFEVKDRHVANDILESQTPVRISTVWLGLDHNFGDGPPLIFETMVFGGKHDDYQERYSTEQAAWLGHERILGALRAGKAP